MILRKIKVLLIYIKTFKELPFGENRFKLNWQLQLRKTSAHRQLDYILSDKLLVRNYVAMEIGYEYLIPLQDVVASINYLKLESYSFPIVIKSTDGSGVNIIARQLSDVTIDKLDRLERSLKKRYYQKSNELQYSKIHPRILVESCLLQTDGKLPTDFKFHCFNGSVKFIFCSIDREGKNYRKIYNRYWQLMPVSWSRIENYDKFDGEEISKPLCLARMIEIAEQFARRSKYCRIDLYCVDERIFFGEYTHYHGGGLEWIRPEEFNQLWGAMLLD